MELFAKFEHEGWQRVAGKYDSIWASSTRQFILPLLDAAEVSGGMSVPDVGGGPGYVWAAATARGAIPRGVRTAGLRARQTPARLQAIQSAIEESVRRYAKGDGFAIPKAAYVIAMGKKVRMEKEEGRKQGAAACDFVF